MPNVLSFQVNGVPQGKGRPRFTRAGHTYTPQKTKDYEARVKVLFKAHCGESPFLCDSKPALAVRILAVYPIPKSYTKKQRHEINVGILKPTKSPDVDNIAKILCDAINGIAYKDDSQIVSLRIDKRYAYKGEDSHVRVAIKEAIERGVQE